VLSTQPSDEGNHRLPTRRRLMPDP
jgi:hypothetical protein